MSPENYTGEALNGATNNSTDTTMKLEDVAIKFRGLPAAVPLTDILHAGTPIDPETGDDLEAESVVLAQPLAIAVEVSGGVVTDIRASVPGAQAYVLDWDDAEAEEGEDTEARSAHLMTLCPHAADQWDAPAVTDDEPCRA